MLLTSQKAISPKPETAAVWCALAAGTHGTWPGAASVALLNRMGHSDFAGVDFSGFDFLGRCGAIFLDRPFTSSQYLPTMPSRREEGL
jgi:hypothetical protein